MPQKLSPPARIPSWFWVHQTNDVLGAGGADAEKGREGEGRRKSARIEVEKNLIPDFHLVLVILLTVRNWIKYTNSGESGNFMRSNDIHGQPIKKYKTLHTKSTKIPRDAVPTVHLP